MRVERRAASPGKVFVKFSHNDWFTYNNGTYDSDAVVAIETIKDSLKHGSERNYDPVEEEWILEDTARVQAVIEDIRFSYFEDKNQMRLL